MSKRKIAKFPRDGGSYGRLLSTDGERRQARRDLGVRLGSDGVGLTIVAGSSSLLSGMESRV
jgi:hypothetical protein